MPLTNAGATEFTKAVIGEAFTAFNNANAHIGVGDSIVAFAATQTDLQAATNKLRKPMDATYPTRSGLVITARSTFDTASANFSWDEIGLFNALSSGAMLSRKVQALGTKANTQSWQVTMTITVAAA